MVEIIYSGEVNHQAFDICSPSLPDLNLQVGDLAKLRVEVTNYLPQPYVAFLVNTLFV